MIQLNNSTVLHMNKCYVNVTHLMRDMGLIKFNLAIRQLLFHITYKLLFEII